MTAMANLTEKIEKTNKNLMDRSRKVHTPSTANIGDKGNRKNSSMINIDDS